MAKTKKLSLKLLSLALVLLFATTLISGVFFMRAEAAPGGLVDSLPISQAIKDSILFYLPLKGDFAYDGKSTNTVTVDNTVSGATPISFVNDADRGSVAVFAGKEFDSVNKPHIPNLNEIIQGRHAPDLTLIPNPFIIRNNQTTMSSGYKTVWAIRLEFAGLIHF